MQDAEAGPSDAGEDTSHIVPPQSPTASMHSLPSTQYYSIEYPGYVQLTSTPLAINRLGGQGSVDAAFKRPGGKPSSLLELHLRPRDPFAHPIAGEIVATNNIVLKVVKRKRKRVTEDAPPVGEYVVEAMGVIPKTARFRSQSHVRYCSLLR